jgi:hypothetical protein
VDIVHDAAWAEAKARLGDAHEALQRALGAMTDAELERPVPGKGYDNYFMLHGVVQHTLYHAGQIILLKKEIRRRGG